MWYIFLQCCLSSMWKAPKFSLFSEDFTQKGEFVFKQWVFKVKSVMQSHTEAALREGIVCSLQGVTADLVWYLGLHAPESEMINKLELMHDPVISFNVFMQNFYKLQQGKIEKVPVYVTKLKEVLNLVQGDYPNMLSTNEVQKHLRNCLFHGLINTCVILCAIYMMTQG